jgi:formamidopyrimidine-DNA glycosylase
MPELPEVETIRRDLADLVVGKMISHLVVADRRALEGFGPDGSRRRRVDPVAFEGRLKGRRVSGVGRRGKYLLLHLDDGASLLVHLRMTGRLVWGPPDLRARVQILFDDESNVLSFCDTRRFGEVWIAEDWREDPSIKALGPEPLEPLDADEWSRGLRRSSAKIQAALLDQKRMAGLGNIYVTEALWRAGIRPARRARTLRESDTNILLGHIRDVLQEGILHRGVSFRDYRDAQGNKGRAGERLAVYGKAGKPCPRCRATLQGAKVNGRGTVFCPRCQK